MLKITVRNADTHDAENFLDTLNASIKHVASASYSSEIIESWAPSIDKSTLDHFIENPDQEQRIVAEINDAIVGIGAIVIDKNELRACYVSPNFLRCGVGTAIIRDLEKKALSQSLDHLQLHAMTVAEPFYKAMGYQALGMVAHITRGGLTMAAVKMRKNL